MGMRAAFVGIDQFSDKAIRDLSGCRRDAVGLHALFTDTFPDLNATLLVDQEATGTHMRAAFEDVLCNAAEDDVAIVSFSAHGTPDHRLVVHDTIKADLSRTSIGMQELAEWFKRSKARVTICILDCCFSGGAPARVIDDAPVPRSIGSPLPDIAGDGRLIIAASNIDEPALELGGHGLLTKALIDALQSSEETVSLVSVMDTVMARVRADAARLGCVQTPVLCGHVEGGVALPTLKKGDCWRSAFPEETQRTLSGDIAELATVGFPQPLVDAWASQFPDGLNKLQLEAINNYGVLDGRSLLVVAPTSSGKTFVGELAAARATTKRLRSAFLFPYKALTNEKYEQFSELYGKKLGLRVIRCTSDAHDEVGSFLSGKYDLALFTYEMFLGTVLGAPWTLQTLGSVVVDEAQFLTDPHRGIVVELLLTMLLRARTRGVAPQLVALSAVIGEINGFDEWLGVTSLVTDERPVPLIEGVLDRSGRYKYRDVDGSVKVAQLLDPWDIQQRRDKPSAQDVIVPLVAKLLRESENERVLIFRNARGPAEGCAAYLARDLGLPPADSATAALPGHDVSQATHRLRECLAGGTAFHNANLGPDERMLVEREYRSNGPLRVLAATTTVAAGINTPASTVILAEQEFKGEDGRAFSVAEVKNMAGRAGRLGYNEQGRAIILADGEFSPDFLFQKYVLAEPEPLRSSFSADELDTWALRLLAQVGEVPREEIVGLLANTYGGYLASRASPSWQTDTEKALEALVAEMLELGLAEEERGNVRLTLLGQACGRSTLSFRSAMRVVRLATQNPRSLSAEGLLVLTEALPECDATYTPLFKKGTAEDRWASEASRRYGMDAVRMLQSQADQNTYRARCKRVMTLYHWLQGLPMEEIETVMRANNSPFGQLAAGHIRGFANEARFRLRSSFEIASIVLIGGAPAGEAVDDLLLRLEFGVPADLIDLIRTVPFPLLRGELLALGRAGIKSTDQLWVHPKADVEHLLGEARVAQLEAARPDTTTSES